MDTFRELRLGWACLTPGSSPASPHTAEALRQDSELHRLVPGRPFPAARPLCPLPGGLGGVAGQRSLAPRPSESWSNPARGLDSCTAGNCESLWDGMENIS